MEPLEIVNAVVAISGALGTLALFLLRHKDREADRRLVNANANKAEAETADILLENYQELLTQMKDDITGLKQDRADRDGQLAKVQADLEAERLRHMAREAELQEELDALRAELAQRKEAWGVEIDQLKAQITALKGQLTRERNLRKQLENELAEAKRLGGLTNGN